LREPAGAGLAALALAGAVVSSVIGVPARRLSRAVERRADDFALELTGDPHAFIEFEQKIAETNLADPQPPRWRSLLFATHPPAVERIGVALAWAAGARPTPPRRLTRCRPRRP
jgi:STE24 endopeptidase